MFFESPHEFLVVPVGEEGKDSCRHCIYYYDEPEGDDPGDEGLEPVVGQITRLQLLHSLAGIHKHK